MKKTFSVLIALLTTSLLVPSAFASSDSAPSNLTYLNNDQLLVENILALNNHEIIKNFLSTEGNSVTFYGVGLDKIKIYDEFLSEYHVPIILSPEEAAKKSKEMKKGSIEAPGIPAVQNSDPNSTPDLSTLPAPDLSESMEVQTDLTIMNHNGNYYVSDGTAYISNNSKVEKFIDNNKLKSQFLNGKKKDELKSFKTDVEKEMTPPSTALGNYAPAACCVTQLTIFRKSNWFYDDSIFYDLDNFEIARSVTDYIIWKTDDNNKDYDYLTIEGKTTWYPAYSDFDVINGVQSSIANYWEGDNLIDYAPNTNSVDQSLEDGDEYAISVGYPPVVNAQVTWKSGSSVNLQAVGDRETSDYYEFFYGTQWFDRYYSIGIGDPVDTTFTASYYSTGTDLGIYVKSSVRHSWASDAKDTYEWMGDWQAILWDYIGT